MSSNYSNKACKASTKFADTASRHSLTAAELSAAAVKRAVSSNDKNSHNSKIIMPEAVEDAEVVYAQWVKENTDAWLVQENNFNANVLRDEHCPAVTMKMKKKLPIRPGETEADHLERITPEIIAHSYAPVFQSTFLSDGIPGQAELLIELKQIARDVAMFGAATTAAAMIFLSGLTITPFILLPLLWTRIWKQELPVRLIVTRLYRPRGFFGRLGNSLGASINRAGGWGTYGYVHTALQIGPVVVEWNDSSLVTPHYNLEDILASLDINALRHEENSALRNLFELMKDTGVQLLSILSFGFLIGRINNNKRKLVAEFCTAWNRTKTYHCTGPNCQNFVDELLTKLQFEPEILKKTAYGPFLETIRRGTAEMKWVHEKTVHVFKSHSQLDRLLHCLSSDEATWDQIDIESKLLLKAFHDTYISRYLSHLCDPRNMTFSEEESFLTDLPSLTCKCFRLEVTNEKTKPMKILPIRTMDDLIQPDGLNPAFTLSDISVLYINRQLAIHRMEEREANGRGVRILVLDGGGVRGFIQGLCLAHLCEKGLQSVIGSFDLICGTSAGGLLALYIVYGAGRFVHLSPEQLNVLPPDGTLPKVEDASLILAMAETLPAKVFPHNDFNKMLADSLTEGWMVRATKLEEELSVAFQGAIMSESAHPKCVVVANRCRGSNSCKCVFRNYSLLDGEKEEQDNLFSSDFISVAAAARMTSSVPIVFPPVRHDEDFLYQDGGIQDNCPISLAVRQARLIWPGRSVEAIVSLGTGRLAPAIAEQQVPPSNQYVAFAKQIVNIATNSHEQWRNFQQDNNGRIPHLLRLDVELQKEIQLFDSDAVTTEELRTATGLMLARREADIDHMVTILNSDKKHQP